MGRSLTLSGIAPHDPPLPHCGTDLMTRGLSELILEMKMENGVFDVNYWLAGQARTG